MMYGLKKQDGLNKHIMKNLFEMAETCDNDTSFRCEIRLVILIRINF